MASQHFVEFGCHKEASHDHHEGLVVHLEHLPRDMHESAQDAQADSWARHDTNHGVRTGSAPGTNWQCGWNELEPHLFGRTVSAGIDFIDEVLEDENVTRAHVLASEVTDGIHCLVALREPFHGLLAQQLTEELRIEGWAFHEQPQ
jgi:hypothetical protein